MEIVAISSDGAAVTVSKPSVTEVGVNDSFSTDSTCSVPNDDDESDAAGNANPPPRGPFSGFRQRRAERIAARTSLRCERDEADAARKKAIEEERRRAQEQQRKAEEAIPERLIEPDLGSLRAGRISVTVSKTESNSYGFGLAQVPRKKNMVKVDALVKEGDKHLLSQSPLREGDILKMVNNQEVTDYRTVMLLLMGMEGRVTMVVETPATQGNPAMIQAFCRKPLPETTIGIEFQVVEHNTTQNSLCRDPNGTMEVTTTKLLQIKTVNPDGYLAHSALRQGDFVLAINDKPCTDTTAEEAAAMILESESTVNILALNPELAQKHCSPTRAQRWMRRARRTGVGVAGGTMLGLGLIMIPLPFPPPFGEVLVVGGVSVLGTEFEAPKRVARSARNALQNAVGNGEKTVSAEVLKQMESVSSNDDGNIADGSVGPGDDNVGESEHDCKDENPTESEKVVLRDSFLTVIGHHQTGMPIVSGDETEPSDEATNVVDCWSQANIDANIENMYSGNEHDMPSSPTGTRHFLKNVGRNVVLPFLDHVVGDGKQGESQGKLLESKPATAKEELNITAATTEN